MVSVVLGRRRKDTGERIASTNVAAITMLLVLRAMNIALRSLKERGR